jgi:15-cis-phytoene synthase
MRFEIARCRELYDSADLGIAMLPERSGRCIVAARTLYSRILDKIEAQGHDVFSSRAGISTARKAVMVATLVLPTGRSRSA